MKLTQYCVGLSSPGNLSSSAPSQARKETESGNERKTGGPQLLPTPAVR